MIKTYYSPTPKKFRKIGDAILLGTTSISGMMMGAPLNDNAKVWVIFILNVVGVLGKVLTNLAKNDDEETPKNEPAN